MGLHLTGLNVFPGALLFYPHPLWIDCAPSNSPALHVNAFFFFSSAKAKAYRLPPVLIVCLYCHPLLLSETGCVPPPTPTALLSITPGWQQTGNPSRPHSASYIALLEGTTSPAGCDELSSVYIERDTWYWCWVIKRDTGMPDWVGLDKKL